MPSRDVPPSESPGKPWIHVDTEDGRRAAACLEKHPSLRAHACTFGIHLSLQLSVDVIQIASCSNQDFTSCAMPPDCHYDTLLRHNSRPVQSARKAHGLERVEQRQRLLARIMAETQSLGELETVNTDRTITLSAKAVVQDADSSAGPGAQRRRKSTSPVPSVWCAVVCTVAILLFAPPLFHLSALPFSLGWCRIDGFRSHRFGSQSLRVVAAASWVGMVCSLRGLGGTKHTQPSCSLFRPSRAVHSSVTSVTSRHVLIPAHEKEK
ncbi:hypothetical protein BDZ85DRAFT_263479 [Elsinoe ampelina]|uniref:Uncharacterized protein n=1 Tax=Elsinoe ampelina TaxID=302913 RepID=A0A6A6G9A8_9PEZI|nr:hypothetical protein BDZ85DRAFT_263479 [Elsinoe ampelina]